MTARLPVPGSDQNAWGQILNDFLSVSHNVDGTVKPAAITTTSLQDSSVSGTKLQDTSITNTKLNAGTGTDGQVLTYTSTATGGLSWTTPANPAHTLTFSLTSFFKTGVLTVTTGVNRLPIDGTYTIVGTRLMVGTAPVGANLIIDVLKNGTTIYTTQANRPTIAAGQNAGGPGVAPDVTSLAAGDYLTVNIAQVGSTTAGSDLTVTIVVNKSV